MHHFPELENIRDECKDEEVPETRVPMRDRAVEGWLSFLAVFFNTGEIVCLFAAAFLSILFASIVAENGELHMILPLAAVGVSLVLGLVLLNFTYVRALAGQRDVRQIMAVRVRAGVSVLICLCLALIHPAIAAVIPVVAGLGGGSYYLLEKIGNREPLWDFLPSEAVSILAGRDSIGLQLAKAVPTEHAMTATVQRACRIMTLVLSLSATSFFIATDYLQMAAFAPVLISSLWAVEALLEYTQNLVCRDATHLVPATEVHSGESVDLDEDHRGLLVQGLSVHNDMGDTLLSHLSFSVEPGSVTGILGESGSGKSVLLQAIIDPFSLNGMEISGTSRINGTDLWTRRVGEQTVSAGHLTEEPILLPTSGADNLSCFHGGAFLERAKWMLEQFLFSTDLVANICDAPDATGLPYMQRKALAVARLFALGPQVYLLDRPENGMPPRQVSALIRRIEHETQIGRCFLIATDDRSILEKCDRIISLQNGRIMDYGDGKEVRERIGSGWARFIASRALISDDNLRFWVRSNFNRTGDDGNRRKVGVVASNMLVLSCQTADPIMPESVHFTFKHFVGYCLLQMQDSDTPISDAQLQMAQDLAESDQPDSKLTPLALICRHCLEVNLGSQIEDRWIEAKIETYDPRKARPKSGATDVKADS